MWPQRLQWPSFAKRKYKVPTFVQTLGLLVFGWLLGIGTLKIYSEATSPRLSQVHSSLGPQVSGLLRHAELSGSQPPPPEEHSMQPVVPPVTLGRTEHSAGARVDKNETEAPTFKAGTRPHSDRCDQKLSERHLQIRAHDQHDDAHEEAALSQN